MVPSLMPIRDRTVALLQRENWIETSRGTVGSMWKPRDLTLLDSGAAIGLADAEHWDEFALRSVVERLAHWTDRPASVVREQIELWDIDVTRLRAANDHRLADSIPLQAGAVLLNSARVMFRSAATAATRGPKAAIHGSYSKLGDALADTVRMGHTERGSYVVPVMVPVGAADEVDQTTEQPLIELATEVESAERRMSRTFADAFSAVQSRIVEPDRIPGPEALLEIVSAGVTTEFVNAVAQVLDEQAVATLEARFNWAASQERPASAVELVSMPKAAVEVLHHTARKMRSQKVSLPEMISGPIIQITADPNAHDVGFAVKTMRRGRPATVHVAASAKDRDEIINWLKRRLTVTVIGKVERISAGLVVRRPSSYGPAEFDLSDLS